MSGICGKYGRREVLLGASTLAIPLVLADGARGAGLPPERFGLGRGQSLDRGWRFYRGEGAFEAPDLDDAAWRHVDLPHDWSVEDLPGPATATQTGPFVKSAAGGTGTGFTVGGEGWYRRRIAAGATPAGSRVEIAFGAIAVISDVWVNGTHIVTHVNAYTPFAVDLTPHLRSDRDTVIVVRARNLGQNSRWYVGSGLYRSITLDVLPLQTRLARDGVSAWTRRLTPDAAEIDVIVWVEGSPADLTVKTVLKDASGRIVASTVNPASGELRQTLSVRNPLLWSPDRPNLHSLEVTLLRGGQEVDRISQSFGIRIVAVSAGRGLEINGKSVKLRGGCVHHDNGLLGAAAFPDADDRRVRLLKARGFNAIRSSHNPASASFLDACDRHGMLLIEEGFDAWHIHKRPDDHATYFKDHWREDLTAMVASARNRACVIMWSIGNEIPERSSEEGLEWSWRLANEVRRLDPTRPVTAGLQEFLGRPIRAAAGTAREGHAGELDQPSTVFLDVAGYNYKLGDIEADHTAYPNRVIYASETYPHEAYDYAALAARASYFLGEFIWTSMDYIGEAGVGLTTRVPEKSPPYGFISFPVYNAYCGDIDLIGDQKPQSLFRDVVWGLSPLEVLVRRPLLPGEVERIPLWGWSDELSSWSWPGSEGKPLAVRIYTSGDRVTLHLNGRELEVRTVALSDKQKVEFSVPYEAGTLEVVAYRSGREIGRKTLVSVTAAAGLRLRPEDRRLNARGQLSFVHIDVLDAAGRLMPDANTAVELTISGPARLIGFGSANPRATGSLQSTSAQTYHGRALAIMRTTGDHGAVRLEARSAGLRSAAVVLRSH